MGKISILDCTLRDGGYCNEWKFGYNNIKTIIQRLVDANVDIIECGFLTQKTSYKQDITKFVEVDQVIKVVPYNRENKMFVCMMNYGEYNPEELPECSKNSIDGIRVAFHKKDIDEAIAMCKVIKRKGYKVFVQPMVSLSYTDEEFIYLIKKCNEISPYAFYIVDSFGVMKRKELRRLFYMIEHNLEEDICIGYHSHNNMQLAYSNAQSLVDIRTKRNIIIDSSIYGMGRGAGNLNTELFVEYLNDNLDTNYMLEPLLSVIDEVLTYFYEKNYWGYSLPNYLSASHNAHPNYANYLDEKKTLTIESINDIFSMMETGKKNNFDKEYIEDLYLRYMENGTASNMHIEEFRELVKDKDVLMIAPGKSAIEQKDRILNCLEKNNLVSIGVNFDYELYKTDYIFVSNARRYRELPKDALSRCISTSNLSASNTYIHTSYKELLNEEEFVKDNAGMMLLKFLMKMGVKKVFVAGLDGYSIDSSENFSTEKMAFVTRKETFEAMNKGMEKVILDYKMNMQIENVTTLKHVMF